MRRLCARAVAVPVLMTSSVLASVCSGLPIYWSFKPDLKLFAALGLANILTIGGVIVASKVFDIDRNFVDPALAKPGYRGRRPFLIMFTLLFLGFASLSHGIVLYAL